MRTVVLAAAVLLALVPAAAAKNTMDIAPTSDFTQVRFEMRMEATGSDAAQMRSLMDSQFFGAGDGDGTVTSAEVEAFERTLSDGMGGDMAESMGDNVTMDGKAATGVQDMAFDVHDAEGPTSSTGTLAMEMAAAIVFQPGPGPTHTLAWNADAGEGDETVAITLSAPSGYEITSAQGLPADAVSSDKKELHFTDAAGNDPEATIVFSPASGSSGAPAAGVAVLASCLAGAALVRRRFTRP